MGHMRNKSGGLANPQDYRVRRAVVGPEWSVPVHSMSWHLFYTFTVTVSIDLDSVKKYNLKAMGFGVRPT